MSTIEATQTFNPLTRIPFIQRILQFKVRDAIELHNLSHVSSPWRETVDFHSEHIWKRMIFVSMDHYAKEFGVYFLHHRAEKARTHYFSYGQYGSIDRFLESSSTNRFFQPLVLHYLGVDESSRVNIGGQPCDIGEMVGLVIHLLLNSRMNDMFFRRLLRMVKCPKILCFQRFYLMKLYEALDIEVMRELAPLFSCEILVSSRCNDINARCLFLIDAGYDYGSVVRYIINVREMAFGIPVYQLTPESLEEAVDKIRPRKYKQRRFVADE